MLTNKIIWNVHVNMRLITNHKGFLSIPNIIPKLLVSRITPLSLIPMISQNTTSTRYKNHTNIKPINSIFIRNHNHKLQKNCWSTTYSLRNQISRKIRWWFQEVKTVLRYRIRQSHSSSCWNWCSSITFLSKS